MRTNGSSSLKPNVKSSDSRISHFYLESNTECKKWVRDDFKIKSIPSEDISVFSKINNSSLKGNPFNGDQLLMDSNYKVYTLLIFNRIYHMEEFIVKNKNTINEGYARHYLISGFTHNLVSVTKKDERYLSKLSDREQEVLSLMARGYSMSKIAKMLFLSPYTIDSHRVNLCKKLEVKRTTELAIWAYKLGLVSDENVPQISR